MNNFDASILTYVNQYARHSVWFDAFMHGLVTNNLLKATLFICLLIFAWFMKTTPEKQIEIRQRVIATYVGTYVAVVVARISTMVMPYTPRPIHTEGFPFTLPYYMDEGFLSDYSSFPSEHMTLFAALNIGLFLISTRYGLIGLCLLMLGGFARLYSGLHRPTDLIAGVVLGSIIGALFHQRQIRALLTDITFKLQRKYPALFYAGLFVASYLVSSTFIDVQSLGGLLHKP